MIKNKMNCIQYNELNSRSLNFCLYMITLANPKSVNVEHNAITIFVMDTSPKSLLSKNRVNIITLPMVARMVKAMEMLVQIPPFIATFLSLIIFYFF